MPAGHIPAPAPHQIRQTMLSEVDRAIAGLSRSHIPDDTVHAVRKDLKRARATLRLMRAIISPEDFRRHNVLMRDAARPLTPLRDSMIQLRTLDDLTGGGRGGNGGNGAEAFTAQLRRHLRLEHAHARAALSDAVIREVAATLGAVRHGLEGLPAQLLDRRALRSGLERAYRRARKAHRRACKDASDDNLHEWRKQTKYYLHQLELIAALDEHRFAKRRKRADRLADRLGDDHDLAVLRANILQQAHSPEAPTGDAMADELLQRLAHRRARLQRKAARLGERLYCEKPRRIGRKAERGLSVEAAPAP